jgi:hypothetical protein
MAKILFLHGLAGRPGGTRVAALCERGHDVYAPAFPYCEAKIQGLMRSLVGQWQRDGRVADPLPQWTELAQDAYRDFDPDLIVGRDLGAVLAMRINSADTPQVLVAPPWSGRVNSMAIVEQIRPPVSAGMQEWLRPVLRYLAACVATDPAIKPATLVIHAPSDEIIDVEESFRLFLRNPALSNSERTFIDVLGRRLSERGYRPLFGRLILAGSDHACDCPDGLTALADVADVALAATVPELVTT